MTERPSNPYAELIERLRACRIKAANGPDWLSGATPDLLDEAAEAISQLTRDVGGLAEALEVEKLATFYQSQLAARYKRERDAASPA